MNKFSAALLLLLLCLLLCFPALGDADGFCDPVPESLAPLLEADARDCVCFLAPDGTQRAFLILDEGWSLQGYTLRAGQWIRETDSTPLEGYLDVYFTRHQPGQPRPDGSAYADAQGFDIVSRQGPWESFHWSGEYYTLCGWGDPDRYDGAVTVDGTVLRYFPSGSRRVEYEADTGDALTLYSWTGSFDSLPAAPEEARKRAAILPSAIENDFPGYTLASYEGYSSGTEADAVFAQVKGAVLCVIQARYDAEKGRTEAYSLMEIPLSARLRDVPAETLWRDRYTLFAQPDALDEKQIHLPGRAARLHVQREQLVLLVEDGESRRVAVVSRDAGGAYQVSLSPALPEGSGLDDFHAGENEIYLYLNHQQAEAGYRKQADGEWRLSWVMGDVNYSVCWWGVQRDWYEDWLIGDLPNADLFTADFSALPRTEAELRQAVNSNGWAAVSNPNPNDRLHLRQKPAKSADSLGKFYNGTPVRVLETRGDWCRVTVGNGGPEGWMMKKYLAFSANASRVERAFPQLFLKEELEGRKLTVWLDGTKRTSQPLNRDEAWDIMGVLDGLYILVGQSTGSVIYAPMDWFWEGNG